MIQWASIEGVKKMTKQELIKLLVLIESVYSSCITKDDTILRWFEFCSNMDYEKVMIKLQNHIRKSPYPPTITDITVFTAESEDFSERMASWKKKGEDQIEQDRRSGNQGPLPAWLLEYTLR
ncbi:hypothetical protein QNH20_13505 [Neobacillus sp. WH10]|uniref:hypothetical protein n=1 Tax=Neobacillus sp. WH10 TaxID=3047873 RepID=UPI0024C0FDE8|nr:hypothetical protein [Neobacillus sp. WH10]WHY75168.1 hypothetical protein QNH20_13505 [Neobacillus sp. WH10]